MCSVVTVGPALFFLFYFIYLLIFGLVRTGECLPLCSEAISPSGHDKKNFLSSEMRVMKRGVSGQRPGTQHLRKVQFEVMTHGSTSRDRGDEQ